MMDEHTFYLRIWRLIIGALCVLILSVAGCVANDNRILAEMVKNGADPIAARCALGTSSTEQQMICAVQVAKGAK